MAGKHGGGHGHGSQGSGQPSTMPTDGLQIEPEAVPRLRSAFVSALSRVDEQLRLAEQELRVTAWAKDPVSQGAAVVFNDRSVDTAASAIDSLRAYRDQLTVAVANLDKTAEQYSAVDQGSDGGGVKIGDGGQ